MCCDYQPVRNSPDAATNAMVKIHLDTTGDSVYRMSGPLHRNCRCYKTGNALLCCLSVAICLVCVLVVAMCTDPALLCLSFCVDTAGSILDTVGSVVDTVGTVHMKLARSSHVAAALSIPAAFSISL